MYMYVAWLATGHLIQKAIYDMADPPPNGQQ